MCCDTGFSRQIRRLTSGCIASFLSVLYTLSEHGCSYPHARFVSPVYPCLRNPQDKQFFYLLHLTGEIAGGLRLSIIEKSLPKRRSRCCGFPTQHWHCLGALTTHKSPGFCTPSVAPGISCRDVFAGKPLARNGTWPNTFDQQGGTIWYKRMQKRPN